MNEIDGDHPARQIRTGRRHQRRDLNETRAPDEVGLKRWTQGISSPPGPWDFAAGLPCRGVIHRNNDRAIGRQAGGDLVPNHAEDGLRINSVLGEDAVVRRPVTELATGGRNQSGNRLSGEPDKMTQEQTLGPLPVAILAKGVAAQT